MPCYPNGKEPVLKTGDVERHCRFESCARRQLIKIEKVILMIRNKLYYQNRINLLLSRGRDNGNIVKKLKRKLNSLDN